MHWLRLNLMVTGWLLAVGAVAAEPSWIIEPVSVGVQVSSADVPGALSPNWEQVSLPDNWERSHPGMRSGTAWYRVEFQLPAQRPSGSSWALYLPYLYDGGRFWLNGAPLGSIAQTTEQTHVRWERPHLITMPDSQLLTGMNTLLLRAVPSDPGAGLRLQKMSIGPNEELLPLYDQRMFWVRTMPQMAMATCLVVGLFVCFVWWRRRVEVLYGLFGLAAILWSIRTLVFLIEVLPASWWPWWRTMYHAATGGFIVALALFAMSFAGVRQPWVVRSLFAYWLIGPMLMVLSGGRLDPQVGFVWTGGLIPIGLAIIGLTAWAAWQQRSASAIALFLAMAIGTLAGLHDYAVAWDGAFYLPQVLGDWTAQRFFFLHQSADLLLLVMVAILSARFVQAMDASADLTLHLEDRVAARELELQTQHGQLARLEREQAVANERRRIMQDLHDGLGSQMFTSLSRVERGAIDTSELAQMLRNCIADMRLTFEVIAPEDAGFRTTLIDFRFRWDGLLKGAGLTAEWQFDTLTDALVLAPTTSLQVLRITQEALTNVLKHAKASRVSVRLTVDAGQLELRVEDDGCGFSIDQSASAQTHGLSGMKLRANQLGATLVIHSQPGATCVILRLPLNAKA